MLDYSALSAVAAVVQTGSFEKAARRLNVTPSAVSQRVKQIEERLGVALIVRGTPCVATETGDRLCRHMETVGLLERDLLTGLPGLGGARESSRPVTVPVAVNADSLATWFLAAAAQFSRASGVLLDISVDDQDHTADWLLKGRVLAAVTGLEAPVTGCRRVALGALRYHATASPDFVARHFADGVTAAALSRAPALIFNQKDGLQSRWIRQTLGMELPLAGHGLPSSEGFVAAALAGMGWGMNPAPLVRAHLAAGRLVELIPGAPLDVPLFWQISRLAADPLAEFTRAVTAVARQTLAA